MIIILGWKPNINDRKVLSYFTINLLYKIRHDLVSNLIKVIIHIIIYEKNFLKK